jgi:acyl transferase domain-containing protein/NADP-dependent 3-hydroxy acid dehydrogenase YdfG
VSDPVGRTPLAVVGIDCLFPGSTDAAGFWRDILAGSDQMREVPATHWRIEDHYDPDPSAPDRTYARRGAFLSEVEFDPLQWGIPPSTLPATDTSQLLALIVAQRVLSDATAGRYREMDRSRVSVILGVTGGQELLGAMVSRLQRPVWAKALRETGLEEDAVERAVARILEHYVPWQESTFPGLLGNVVAGRIANRLDLGGTNCITDAACASSMSALSMAASELYMGDSDLVITGGVDTMNDVFMFMCFSKTPALSPSGDCRPFSSDADGTMLGEGIGMVALKRLADAERDGDRIYALVRGVGSSSDGGSTSVYAPVSGGQAKAIRRAYEHAGYGPGTVELVEAHGTGTKAGDLAEFDGLRAVFAEAGRDDRQWCALGSVKALIGHTKAAAGAAGLFKAVLALQHHALPPMPKVDEPDPRLDFADSAFYINTRARPWVRGSAHERRAGVSSFGFGGSNFHATVSEYTGPAPKALRLRATDAELVLLCGEPADVELAARRHAERATLPDYLAWLSRTTLADYAPNAPLRLAVVARGEEDLAAKLTAAADGLAAGQDLQLPGVQAGFGPARGEAAFLFPGQGSQYLHMGADVAIAFAAAMSAWDLAADLGRDIALHDVVFPPAAFTDGDRERQTALLRATEWAQPAIGTASLALLRLLGVLGVTPAAVGGHSFGEVTALHAAGAIDADTMLAVARRRGELMHAASTTPGAMLAVGAPIAEVRETLDRLGSTVVIANHNGPRQVVLSGSVEAIDAAAASLAETGVGCLRLDVATAFHSPIVAGAAGEFAAYLESVELNSPQLPVYSNTTATPYPRERREITQLLARALAEPVRFAEMIDRMYADGVRTFIEVGPGNVLSGLVHRILEERPHAAVALDGQGASGLVALLQGIGGLAAAGISMHPAALWDGYRVLDDPHERAKPRLSVALSGANGRPSIADERPPGRAGTGERPAPSVASALRTGAQASAVPPGSGSSPAPSTAMPAAPALVTPALVTPVHTAPAGDLDALVAIHEQAAKAHMAYIEAIGQLHESYLRGYAETVARLSGDGWSPSSHPEGADSGQPAAELTLPRAAAPPPEAATPAHGEVRTPEPAGPLSAPEPAAAPATPEPGAVVDMGSLLLDVVAAKTGFPQEMLALEMELARDLGIDSIKRVEILSGMRERLPGMPEVDMAALAELATLGQIVDYMSARAQGSAAPDVGPQPRSSHDQGRPSTPPDPMVPGPPAAVAISRQVPAAVATPAPGLAMNGLYDGPIAVTDDGGGVARALVDELRSHGVDAELAEGVPSNAAGLVLCDCLDGGSEDTLERSLRSFAAARALAPQLSEHGGLFVAVQDTGGSFGLDGGEGERAWVAGLAGLARTAAREWPKASVKTIDVQRRGRDTGAVAAAIAAELLGGGAALEAGLHADGARVTLVDLPRGVGRAQPRLSGADVVVISGGARGVTAACAIELARATGARLVLLGRTELRDDPAFCEGLAGAELRRALLAQADGSGESVTPAQLGSRAAAIESAREVRGTLAAIERAGSAVRYVAVEVTDLPAVTGALARIRADWGPITAVIHGAGVLADKLIAETTDQDFARVFSTKVLGLRALLEATAGDPLAVLCVFSSLAARRGNVGQAGYAMANEVMSKVAQAEQARRGAACLVRAIGWGPWAGGMVTPQLQEHFRAQGVELLPPELGARAFLSEIGGGFDDGVEVTLSAGGGDWPAASNGDGRHRADVLVSDASHPQLAGHAISGNVVVPVAYAVEWMARTARSIRPDRALTALEDIRVLKGITLSGFAEGLPARLTVGCRAVNGSGAEIELVAPDDSIAYSCVADWGPRSPVELPALELSVFDGDTPYAARSLFHGPPFQVVARVDGIGDRGIRGVLRGVHEMKWSGEPWLTDPAALDGVLQLSVLWIERMLGLRALPTSIGSLRLHGPPVRGPVHCSIAVSDANDLRMRGDAVVCDAQGKVVFELLDLEAHVLPDRP